MRLSLEHYRPIMVCQVHILYEERQNEVLGVFCQDRELCISRTPLSLAFTQFDGRKISLTENLHTGIQSGPEIRMMAIAALPGAVESAYMVVGFSS